MILVVQFRTDQSGWHEAKCLYDSMGRNYHELLVLNAQTPGLEAKDIVAFAKRARGVIIGGWGENGFEAESKKDKTTLQKVIKMTAPLVKYLLTTEVPVLGLCFGHQLVAHVLGAKVKRDESSAETGIVEVTPVESGMRSPLFDNIKRPFSVIEGHKASVMSIPQGAELLASSEKCTIQALRFRKNGYTVQFHPELDFDALQYRLNLYPEYTKNGTFKPEGVDVEGDKVLTNYFKIVDQYE